MMIGLALSSISLTSFIDPHKGENMSTHYYATACLLSVMALTSFGNISATTQNLPSHNSENSLTAYREYRYYNRPYYNYNRYYNRYDISRPYYPNPYDNYYQYPSYYGFPYAYYGNYNDYYYGDSPG